MLQRAQLLAATAHLSASYLNDLEALAHRLLGTASAEAAAQAFALAFAHATPRLLPDHLAPAAADAEDPWRDYPTVSLQLQPITRGGNRGVPNTGSFATWTRWRRYAKPSWPGAATAWIVWSACWGAAR